MTCSGVQRAAAIRYWMFSSSGEVSFPDYFARPPWKPALRSFRVILTPHCSGAPLMPDFIPLPTTLLKPAQIHTHTERSVNCWEAPRTSEEVVAGRRAAPPERACLDEGREPQDTRCCEGRCCRRPCGQGRACALGPR
uniref:Uncharacterized protein n=1 Tax=Myotis myotis TaxID=51298 RepID=A0A7J7RCI8_MYOMY|nr:hypothetical protein mMyoMyo1_010832 [Myotis myotis]